jgi:biotin transporter BioY
MSKPLRQRSPKFVAFIWFCALLSAGFLYLMGRITYSNFSQFRSCNANSSGLLIQNCGKQSFNLGDLLILVFFVLSAALAVSMFTASWRATRRSG